MPPQFIDSDSEPEVVNETKKSTRAAADEDMEDEELEEEEYIVEAIKDHKWRAKVRLHRRKRLLLLFYEMFANIVD